MTSSELGRKVTPCFVIEWSGDIDIATPDGWQFSGNGCHGVVSEAGMLADDTGKRPTQAQLRKLAYQEYRANLPLVECPTGCHCREEEK